MCIAESLRYKNLAYFFDPTTNVEIFIQFSQQGAAIFFHKNVPFSITFCLISFFSTTTLTGKL